MILRIQIILCGCVYLMQGTCLNHSAQPTRLPPVLLVVMVAYDTQSESLKGSLRCSVLSNSTSCRSSPMNGNSRSCRLRSDWNRVAVTLAFRISLGHESWLAEVAVVARDDFAGREVDVVRWKAGSLSAGYAASS